MSQTLVDISLIKDRQVAQAIDDTNVILSNASSIPGNTTGTASAAGKLGQTIGGSVVGTGTTATVTITIAAPGVITWTAHGFSTVVPQPVVFTTSSSLPTGITSGTVYYTVPSSVTTNTFTIATTVANALAGTAVTTSGSQAGTQTGTAGCALANNTAIDVTGASFTAGDWDIWAQIAWDFGATTTWTKLEVALNTTSATLPTAATTPVVAGSYASLNQISAAATNGVSTVNLPATTWNISATTTMFLLVKCAFGTSTAGARGFIMGRRRA